MKSKNDIRFKDSHVSSWREMTRGLMAFKEMLERWKLSDGNFKNYLLFLLVIPADKGIENRSNKGFQDSKSFWLQENGGLKEIYYYYSSSNLRAHGVCDYGTLPVMWQDLTSYLTIYIYKYIRPFRMIFFYPMTVKLSKCLLRLRN